MNADGATQRRLAARAARARALALALALSAPVAHGKLPREVGRAFLDAGIPLNHVGDRRAGDDEAAAAVRARRQRGRAIRRR